MYVSAVHIMCSSSTLFGREMLFGDMAKLLAWLFVGLFSHGHATTMPVS